MKTNTPEEDQRLAQAVRDDDIRRVREILAGNSSLKARINEPLGPFESPLINSIRSPAMLDALLEAGADINAKSRWWAGGFGLLHSVDPSLAAYAIDRGAHVDVHAAARLGLFERLRRLVESDPALVHARGGDGQTPLHFASTVEIAEFLLDRGADIDARDIDHESTPAQYMVRDRQTIVRRLVQRGCQTDILLAAALGDADLVRRHLDAKPECIHTRVTAEFFPMLNLHSGGTIYQWTLGWFVSPHQIAREFGHEEVRQVLMDRSPPDVRLLVSCWANDEGGVKAVLADQPNIAGSLSEGYRRHLAHAARENNLPAVRLMLAAGLPVDARGQHQATALHWAAFHGNLEMTRELLRFAPPLEALDADFSKSPLGWAVYGSQHGWFCRTGDYAGTVEALLQVGAIPPDPVGGTDAVQEVFRRRTTS